MRTLMIAAIAAVAIPSPVLAGANDEPEDKVVCKRVLDTNTGSNFRGRSKVCRKASDWKEIEDAKDRTLQRAKDGRLNPNQAPTMGGAPG